MIDTFHVLPATSRKNTMVGNPMLINSYVLGQFFEIFFIIESWTEYNKRKVRQYFIKYKNLFKKNSHCVPIVRI